MLIFFKFHLCLLLIRVVGQCLSLSPHLPHIFSFCADQIDSQSKRPQSQSQHICCGSNQCTEITFMMKEEKEDIFTVCFPFFFFFLGKKLLKGSFLVLHPRQSFSRNLETFQSLKCCPSLIFPVLASISLGNLDSKFFFSTKSGFSSCWSIVHLLGNLHLCFQVVLLYHNISVKKSNFTSSVKE